MEKLLETSEAWKWNNSSALYLLQEFNSSMKYLDDEEAKFGESLPESGIGVGAIFS